MIKSRVRTRKRTDIENRSRFESEPLVTYEYAVGGRTYRGNRLSFAERISGVDVGEMLKRYPDGKVVQVYYNPANPAQAVIERSLPQVSSHSCGAAGARPGSGDLPVQASDKLCTDDDGIPEDKRQHYQTRHKRQASQAFFQRPQRKNDEQRGAHFPEQHGAPPDRGDERLDSKASNP